MVTEAEAAAFVAVPAFALAFATTTAASTVAVVVQHKLTSPLESRGDDEIETGITYDTVLSFFRLSLPKASFPTSLARNPPGYFRTLIPIDRHRVRME
jgi:hypothetical protein